MREYRKHRSNSVSRSNRALWTLCVVGKLSFVFFSFRNGDFLESAHCPPPIPGATPWERATTSLVPMGSEICEYESTSEILRLHCKRRYKETNCEKGCRETLRFQFLKRSDALWSFGRVCDLNHDIPSELKTRHV